MPALPWAWVHSGYVLIERNHLANVTSLEDER